MSGRESLQVALGTSGAGSIHNPLLADAEGGEDAVQDIVRGGDAGDGVDGLEGTVEVEQEEFVGKAGARCFARLFEHGGSFAEQVFVAQAVDETALCLYFSVWC